MIKDEEMKLLCDLSKLCIAEDELENYSKEMNDIISLMDTIGESDFEYNPIDNLNAVPFSLLRADTVETYENMQGIVANGPEVIANQFVVPKIVD